jgi:hypothetical protein
MTPKRFWTADLKMQDPERRKPTGKRAQAVDFGAIENGAAIQ